MIDDMRNEAIELIVTACEKHAANNEVSILLLWLFGMYLRKRIESSPATILCNNIIVADCCIAIGSEIRI